MTINSEQIQALKAAENITEQLPAALEAWEKSNQGIVTLGWIHAANPVAVESLLAERDADKALIAELTEALKQSVAGYKSCLRMGYDRIIDLGGECDAPELMIAGNPDIQQAEKILAAGITLDVGE